MRHIETFPFYTPGDPCIDVRLARLQVIECCHDEHHASCRTEVLLQQGEQKSASLQICNDMPVAMQAAGKGLEVDFTGIAVHNTDSVLSTVERSASVSSSCAE